MDPGSVRYEEQPRSSLRYAEVSRIQDRLYGGIASVCQRGANHFKEVSFCRLGDADHVLEDNPFGLEELDDADVLKEEPVLRIGLRPCSLVGG